MTFAIKAFLATVCHPERSRSLRVKTSKPRCVAPQGSRKRFPCLYFRNKVTINSKEIPMLRIASCLTKIFIKNYAIGNSTKNNMLLNINLGNRHCRRVRLRLRSAQDDTKGSVAEDFKKNNPSVTLSRATSLCTKEAES